MTFINPVPETSFPIVKPREDETLRSWLARKIHAQFNNHDFGALFPGQSQHSKRRDQNEAV